MPALVMLRRSPKWGDCRSPSGSYRRAAMVTPGLWTPALQTVLTDASDAPNNSNDAVKAAALEKCTFASDLAETMMGE